MNTTRRTQRMAALIQAELSRVLLEEVSDPALEAISVSGVKVAADLKLARVFYTSAKPTNKPQEIKKGLTRATPFLRRKLGSNLELRYVPELVFELDSHAGELDRLYRIMYPMENHNKDINNEDNPSGEDLN